MNKNDSIKLPDEPSQGHGRVVIGFIQRDRQRPLEKLTDAELATLGALGGIAPYFRSNISDQLHILGRLAGMEENRRYDRIE